MKICEYIEEIIEDQGRRKDWTAEKSGIKYKTFLDKLEKDTFTAYELISIGKLVDIDLNEFKNMTNGGVITMLDKKQRPEVGIQDMDKYEFGGLEIDNELTNGYHLYIPYGIHCDIFKAIQDSIRLMQNQRRECEDTIKKLENSIDDLKEEHHKNMASQAILLQKQTIERIDNNLKVFEKIEPLINEI